jgi:hypothetical protein
MRVCLFRVSALPRILLFFQKEDGSCRDFSIGSELLCDCDEDVLVECNGIDLNTSPIKVSLRLRVHFAPEVSVVQIPSHREYSEEERDFIWTNGSMLGMQARRNTAEWHWEGCDAEDVTEEDEFRRDCFMIII